MTAAVSGVPWSSDLRSLAARFGEAPAITDGQGASLSYRELCRRAHGLTAYFIGAGIELGQPVATLLPNGLAAVWASYGITLSGAAETPLNWAYTDTEIEWSARLAKFPLVVTTKLREASLRAMGLEVIAVEKLRPTDGNIERPPVPADTWGRISFTSGTTGRPKGVICSHGRRWLAHILLKSTLPFVPAPGARILLMTPFTHGASLLTFAWLDYGGEVILLDGVDTEQAGVVLERGDVAAVFAPPTVIAKLADAFETRRFSGVRCVFTGTQTLTPLLYDKAFAMFGPVVRVTYGKTECVNPITVLLPADTHRHFTEEGVSGGGCVGWPSSGVEISVRGEDGNSLPAEATGEVWLRARHMYLGHIDASGFHPLEAGGWHQTGDLGRIDLRGRLWLAGRLADVIETGGYKVLPEEIEAIVSGIPGCEQICVTSLPSEYWGEVIVAVAERVTGDWRSEAEHRVAQLSKHKRPRVYVAVEALPRNPQGKVSRREVTKMVLVDHQLIDGPHPHLVAKRTV